MLDSLPENIAADLFEALEEASQSIFYVIQDGCFVWGNRRGCRITGLDSHKDVIGKPALTFVHPDDRPILADMSGKVMKGETIQPFEWRLRTVDGEIVWVLGFLMKISFKGRPALLGNYIDITRAKQTHLELQNTYKRLEDLTHDLDSAREEERGLIAWELQENLGYALNSIKNDIAGGGGEEEGNGEKRDILLHKVDSVLDSLARISTHLTRPQTDPYEFNSAIREFVQEFEDRTGISLNLKIPRERIGIGEKAALAVYGIFQEMLKYLVGLGGFKRVDIVIDWDLSRLSLQLIGIGREIKQEMHVRGVRRSLRLLSARIEEWNGALNVEKRNNRLDLSATFNLAVGSGPREIRVLLGCSQPLFMEGLGRIISGAPEFIICDQAVTWPDLIDKMRRPDIDMLILDAALLGGRATDNMRQLKDDSPHIPILVVNGMGDDDDFAVRLLRQGASGCLSRSSSTNELLSAIHKVAVGRKHISSRIAEKLAFEVDVYSPKPFHHRLSDRERQVMFMIADGKTMKEIASDLCLSYKTIATYRNRVLEKMKMSNDAEIIRYVVSKGLI